MAVLGSLGATAVAASALVAGVTPAQAANFANQPDTQIAVFMVPLTLLVLVLLFEVARFAWRGTLPAQAPTPAPRPTNWAQKRKAS
jgi:cytochrome b561